jgi:hypothetical protein
MKTMKWKKPFKHYMFKGKKWRGHNRNEIYCVNDVKKMDLTNM